MSIPIESVKKPSATPSVRMKRKPEHYVNNKEFSQAVVDYVNVVKSSKSSGKEIPRISEYIGKCFLKIAEGLSHKPNFIRYTYREEMVMDGVENCIKAIMNYNIDAATRTGTPNAFAYFTQICYYAFIRRIMKEKKQQDIKFRYIEHAGIEDFMTESLDGVSAISSQECGFIDVLKKRIHRVKTIDKVIKEFKKKEKDPKKDLELFMDS
jgi:hypothetical protein